MAGDRDGAEAAGERATSRRGIAGTAMAATTPRGGGAGAVGGGWRDWGVGGGSEVRRVGGGCRTARRRRRRRRLRSSEGGIALVGQDSEGRERYGKEEWSFGGIWDG